MSCLAYCHTSQAQFYLSPIFFQPPGEEKPVAAQQQEQSLPQPLHGAPLPAEDRRSVLGAFKSPLGLTHAEAVTQDYSPTLSPLFVHLCLPQDTTAPSTLSVLNIRPLTEEMNEGVKSAKVIPSELSGKPRL